MTTPTLRLAPLERDHRTRVREILEGTRSFSPAEVDVALELFDDAVGVGDTSAIATAARVDAPDYELLGAYSGGELLGYACYGPTPGTDRSWDLYWIATDATRHGEGVGSRLLHGVEELLAHRGSRLLVAETSSRDEYDRTRRFYRSRGYAEAARLRDFYARGDDRIMYVKRLDAAAPRADQSPVSDSEPGVPR